MIDYYLMIWGWQLYLRRMRYGISSQEFRFLLSAYIVQELKGNFVFSNIDLIYATESWRLKRLLSMLLKKGFLVLLKQDKKCKYYVLSKEGIDIIEGYGRFMKKYRRNYTNIFEGYFRRRGSYSRGRVFHALYGNDIFQEGF